ncbi:hypothetical protein M378DRAFT_170305 [Amanita muscaria Koide BX008]|uniref:Uncharacterized protein n=1 Tax=Amanita muscaria (strain Koide BX008) TaxID=946122 RepID=A0A0C2WBK3_AMAMK|nr:hypothetical protein M378DRAFT_170305 [Amanita muscaria Koide BX008]
MTLRAAQIPQKVLWLVPRLNNANCNSLSEIPRLVRILLPNRRVINHGIKLEEINGHMSVRDAATRPASCQGDRN